MFRYLLQLLHPRREPFWRGLLVLGAIYRVWAVLSYRNPMNAIFSDAARHWDNGKRFLDPGPMGASNPFFYQLYIWLLQLATGNSKLWIGLATAALSVAYPLCFYLLARNVLRRRVTALRYAVVLSFLPTHVAMFGYFMNETLLFPLLGLALWATWKAAGRRSAPYFVLASALWVMAVLTRSVVLPLGGLLMLWAWKQQRRKILVAVAAAALVSVGFGFAAVRAHKLLNRYTPFGDNANVAIYFASAAHDYKVSFIKKGGRWGYGFASPSLYVSPFEPFRWKSARKGTFSFVVDADKKGADVQKTLADLYVSRRHKLPRMIFENFVFLTFGHAWPEAGHGDLPARVCLWERWIWFPLILFTFLGSLVRMWRRGPAFVPLVTVLFTGSLYAAQVALMEGRYRKPIEPVLLLALFWLVAAFRRTPREIR